MDFDENGSVAFTDAEREDIAAQHCRIAASLWRSVERCEAKGDMDRAARYRSQACDAEDIAEAARTSSAALARIY